MPHNVNTLSELFPLHLFTHCDIIASGDNMNDFSEMLTYLRKREKLSQQELGDKLGLGKSTISMYENGKRKPSYEVLEAIADYFKVNISLLMGKEMGTDCGVSPGTRRINVLGSIRAGIPAEAVEDIVDWEEIPEEMCKGGKEYFGLKVKGDSMWPDFLEGDVVIIQKTPVCNNGNICAVYVNGYDATLKQIKLGDDGSITLQPRNPSYPPRTYTKEEVEQLPVTIAGVVVELRRKFNF